MKRNLVAYYENEAEESRLKQLLYDGLSGYKMKTERQSYKIVSLERGNVI